MVSKLLFFWVHLPTLNELTMLFVPYPNKFIFCCLLYAWATLAVVAQSPYRPLQLPTEANIVGMSVIGIRTSLVFKEHKPTLNAQQITQLLTTTPHCPRFERFVTRNWDTRAQQQSDYLLMGAMATPLLLLASPQVRRNSLTAGTIGIETYLLTGALTNLTKELTQRRRPYVYNPNAPLAAKMQADATSSFFSGHVSYTASSTFLAAKMYADYHPHSRLRPYVWTTAALLPAAVAYLRVKGGKHYLTDVAVGYVVGAAVGILVPELHRKRGF